jgi:hypothetical protein
VSKGQSAPMSGPIFSSRVEVDNGDSLVSVCRVDHLTSFASGYFPTPNLIDFQFIYSDFTLKVLYILTLLYSVNITKLRTQTAVSSKSGTGSIQKICTKSYLVNVLT